MTTQPLHQHHDPEKYQKQKIPKAIREQVWLRNIGKKYESKCKTTWCHNIITVFDFQCGHDIPESKGGETKIYNLFPICSRCNLSMSNNYTFKEWCNSQKRSGSWLTRLLGCKQVSPEILHSPQPKHKGPSTKPHISL
jgi:5-methylcytosine-specific restriction endonuclease McrA